MQIGARNAESGVKWMADVNADVRIGRMCRKRRRRRMLWSGEAGKESLSRSDKSSHWSADERLVMIGGRHSITRTRVASGEGNVRLPVMMMMTLVAFYKSMHRWSFSD